MAQRGRVRGRRGRHQAVEEGRPSPIVQPPVQHRFLRFPDTIPDRFRHDYIRRLSDHLHKEVEVAHALDWELTDRLQLSGRLTRLLPQVFRAADGTTRFTCHAWERLFRVREPCYRELMIEFYSTVDFLDTSTAYEDRGVFSFRLGGVSRECALRDLGWRLGIYTHDETRHEAFLDFLASGLRHAPADFSPYTYWDTIGHGLYVPARAVESGLLNPIHRLLHRLITTTVSHRRGGEKVPVADLFLMWAILTPTELCNIPYQIAYFLGKKGMGAKRSSPMCGGHLITRLARSYGVLTREVEGLHIYQPRVMTELFLETIQVIQRLDDGVRILDAEARVDERQRQMQRRSPLGG